MNFSARTNSKLHLCECGIQFWIGSGCLAYDTIVTTTQRLVKRTNLHVKRLTIHNSINLHKTRVFFQAKSAALLTLLISLLLKLDLILMAKCEQAKRPCRKGPFAIPLNTSVSLSVEERSSDSFLVKYFRHLQLWVIYYCN